MFIPGGEGYPTKFYTGRLRPEVHPSPLDRPHLTEKGYPIRLIWQKWYPFHIPSLELCILLTAANVLSFKYESNTKPERFPYFSGMKLLSFSKTRENWSSKAALTITIFAAVNHIYDHKQRTLKHRNTHNWSKSTNHKSQFVTFWTR